MPGTGSRNGFVGGWKKSISLSNGSANDLKRTHELRSPPAPLRDVCGIRERVNNVSGFSCASATLLGHRSSPDRGARKHPSKPLTFPVNSLIFESNHIVFLRITPGIPPVCPIFHVRKHGLNHDWRSRKAVPPGRIASETISEQRIGCHGSSDRVLLQAFLGLIFRHGLKNRGTHSEF